MSPTWFNMRKMRIQCWFATAVSLAFPLKTSGQHRSALDNINIVNSQGRTRTSRRTLSELHFDCEVRSLGECLDREKNVSGRIRCSFLFAVCLQDSVLAFHEHGMQGRSLKDNEVTQEVYDHTRTFRVIGSDRYVVRMIEISFLQHARVISIVD